MKPLKQIGKTYWNNFQQKLISADLTDKNTKQRIFYLTGRTIYLAVYGFIKDLCPTRASALTLIFLISLVPLLAFVLSLSKGMGGEKALEELIDQQILNLPGGKEVQIFLKNRGQFTTSIEEAEEDIGDLGKSLKLYLNSLTRRPDISNTIIEPTQLENRQADAGIEPAQLENSPADTAANPALLEYRQQVLKLIPPAGKLKIKNRSKFLDKFNMISPIPPGNISFQAFFYKQQIFHFVNRTNFKVVGAVGLIALLITVILAMGNIEQTFNHIWEIKHSRSLVRKFTDYLSVLVVAPVLLLASTTLTAILSNQALLDFLDQIGLAKLYISTLGASLPLLGLFITFFILYIFLPNCKVKYPAAMVGAAVASILFYLLQLVYFKGQIGLSRYNSIYGAFAAVPFFLIFLQFRWYVVLLGVEFSHAAQNINQHFPTLDSTHINRESHIKLALVIMAIVGQEYIRGGTKAAEKEGKENARQDNLSLAQGLGIPWPAIDFIIQPLIKAGLLLKVEGDNRLVPGRDLAQLTIKDIITALDTYGSSFEIKTNSLFTTEILQMWASLEKKIETLLEQSNLAEIIYKSN